MKKTGVLAVAMVVGIVSIAMTGCKPAAQPKKETPPAPAPAVEAAKPAEIPAAPVAPVEAAKPVEIPAAPEEAVKPVEIPAAPEVATKPAVVPAAPEVAEEEEKPAGIPVPPPMKAE